MKRNLGLLVALATLLLTTARASAPAAPSLDNTVQESTVPVFIDKRLSGAALVRNGEAFVSLRSVAKALNLKVQYNADAQIIIIDTPSAKNKDATPARQ